MWPGTGPEYEMAVTDRSTQASKPMPPDLAEALEQGYLLTEDEVRRLFAYEASLIGLEYDEAVRRARDDSLPKSPIGLSLELLVELLPD